MEGIFPAPREELWKLLKLHVEGSEITRIHGNVLSQREVSREGNRWVVERKLRLMGKEYMTTMAVTVAPPEMYRWEIVASDGLFAPGGFVENKYTEAEGGTKVTTSVEMTLKGVPGVLQGWLIKRNLSQADGEDLKYLKKLPAPST